MIVTANCALLVFLLNLPILKTVRDGQLLIQFWEGGIVGKLPKVAVLKDTYLSLTFGETFLFVYLGSLQKVKMHYYIEFQVSFFSAMVDMNHSKYHNNCF